MSHDLTSADRSQADRALDDDSLWSDPVSAPAGSTLPRDRPKRAQVAVRLEEELLELVHAVAGQAGVAYTTMLRGWIKERAIAEAGRLGLREVRGRRQPHVIAVRYEDGLWQVVRRLPDGAEQNIWKTRHYLGALRAARDVAIAEGAKDLDVRWFDAPTEEYWVRIADAQADELIG